MKSIRVQDFKFSLPLTIRWNDLDPLQHVNNVYYFEYFQMGRGVYMPTVSQRWDWKQNMFVIAHIECDYFVELKLAANNPCVKLRTVAIGNKSFNIEYLITSQDQDGADIIHAKGISTQVLVDLARGGTMAIPDWLRADIKHYDSV